METVWKSLENQPITFKNLPNSFKIHSFLLCIFAFIPFSVFSSTELKSNRFHPSKQSFYFIGSFTSLFVLVREGIRRETARECAVSRRKHHGERWIGRGKGRAKQQDHPERSQQSLSSYQRYAYSGQSHCFASAFLHELCARGRTQVPIIAAKRKDVPVDAEYTECD